MSQRELPKLPQARRYLRAANWGYEKLCADEPEGTAFIFYAIGIMAALRAVQSVLLKHDRTLSSEHRRVIADWKERTKDFATIPDLMFIKQSRDLLIKEGRFDAYAINSQSGTGEGENYTVTRSEYELCYYENGQRLDLAAAIQSSLAWCERELEEIEAQLPLKYEEVEEGKEWWEP